MTISRQNFNITVTDTDPETFNVTDFNNANITLPTTLLDNTMTRGSTVRVAQSTYNNPGLFLGRDIGDRHVASSVFDFTVYNETISNLSRPLNLSLSQAMVSTLTPPATR